MGAEVYGRSVDCRAGGVARCLGHCATVGKCDEDDRKGVRHCVLDVGAVRHKVATQRRRRARQERQRNGAGGSGWGHSRRRLIAGRPGKGHADGDSRSQPLHAGEARQARREGVCVVHRGRGVVDGRPRLEQGDGEAAAKGHGEPGEFGLEQCSETLVDGAGEPGQAQGGEPQQLLDDADNRAGGEQRQRSAKERYELQRASQLPLREAAQRVDKGRRGNGGRAAVTSLAGPALRCEDVEHGRLRGLAHLGALVRRKRNDRGEQPRNFRAPPRVLDFAQGLEDVPDAGECRPERRVGLHDCRRRDCAQERRHNVGCLLGNHSNRDVREYETEERKDFGRVAEAAALQCSHQRPKVGRRARCR